MGQERTRGRHVTGEGMARMILNPLTEVGIGVLMSVMIRCRQLMMNLQRRGEGRHREQQAGEQERDDRTGFFLGEMTKHRSRTISA